MSYCAYSVFMMWEAVLDMLPVFKILTVPQQERVSSCFIYLIQFVSRARKSSDGGQRLSAYTDASGRLCAAKHRHRCLWCAKLGAQTLHSVDLCICVCVVVVQS